MEIQDDGALRLLAAIIRRWLLDEPQELPAVATWLGMPPDVLRRRVLPPAARPGWPACPGCGAELPLQIGGGRRRIWCSERCRLRYNRKKTR